MQHGLRFSPDLFKNDIRSYANWRKAFWRELFQNAIDQSATEITITVAAVDDPDDCLITFHDNGPGMTREILENVYFAVGASSKSDDTNSIGGMGRARMLTCFAMKSYAIRSQYYAVNGVGGQYDISDEPYAPGLTLTVHMDDCSPEQALFYLKLMMSESRIHSTKVVCNDTILTENSGHLGRYIRDLVSTDGITFARVFVNKSIPSKKLLVRVSGVCMFSDDTDVDGQIVVELIPEISRKALTSNRDSLRWEYSRAQSAFQQELAADNQSAVRDRQRRQTTVGAGGGLLTARRKQKPLPKLAEIMVTATSSDYRAVGEGTQRKAAAYSSISEPDHSVDYADVSEVSAFTRWLNSTFGDIFIYVETDSNTMRKSIAQYQPQNWILQENANTGRYVRRGGNIIKVLLAWKVACEYALDIYINYHDIDSVSWGVGFTFSESPALCRQQDGGHVFAIRPVTENGKLDFAVTDRADLLRIMSSAKHEVAHLRNSWHNESYAANREMIDERFDQAECFRRIKEAIKTMPDDR